MTELATTILGQVADGDASAAERLLPLVYEDLRALAGRYFQHQPEDHTLQPTALVHEAFMRLIDQSSVRVTDRTHFFAVAATAMRQILVDHARRARAAKRGGNGRERVSLSHVTPAVPEDVDVLAIDEALTQLARIDTRQHRIVELRFFGGLTMEEIARLLGVSKPTVELDWRAARAWLGLALSTGRT